MHSHLHCTLQQALFYHHLLAKVRNNRPPSFSQSVPLTRNFTFILYALTCWYISVIHTSVYCTSDCIQMCCVVLSAGQRVCRGDMRYLRVSLQSKRETPSFPTVSQTTPTVYILCRLFHGGYCWPLNQNVCDQVKFHYNLCETVDLLKFCT